MVARDDQRSVFTPTKIGLAKMYAWNAEVSGFENDPVETVACSNPLGTLSVVIIHYVCYNLFIIYGGCMKINGAVLSYLTFSDGCVHIDVSPHTSSLESHAVVVVDSTKAGRCFGKRINRRATGHGTVHVKKKTLRSLFLLIILSACAIIKVTQAKTNVI